MSSALLLNVRLYDGRYHGRPDWPPSPARLFQALVAGAAEGATISPDAAEALHWLESLDAPLVAAPPVRDGKYFVNYVPNNNLDSVGGDPARISKIRVGKAIRPRLIETDSPIIYAWRFDEGSDQAARICAIAERLYQLGRGVDMAWATGEIIEAVEGDARIDGHGGAVYRPATSGDGLLLACPQPGSLKSLMERHEKSTKRFSRVRIGRSVEQILTQAPKPSFAAVRYNSPPRRFLYEIRRVAVGSEFAAQPLVACGALVERLRDAAAARLRTAMPEKTALVDRVLVGRGAAESDKGARVRIVPLPSIGSPHVTRSIRRVLIEVPPNCPLDAADIAWAFSGIDLADPETGEIEGSLVAADDFGMLGHYGIDSGGRSVWRSVTPVALPERAARRRIDPVRLRAELQAVRAGGTADFHEAKSGRERAEEERRAAGAVMHALRHAGLPTRVASIQVQREPFEARGARAEDFAPGTRFAKERLWHVKITFAEPVDGPIVIGDGRYLGLGLMAPWP